jgi:hypothetical protein
VKLPDVETASGQDGVDVVAFLGEWSIPGAGSNQHNFRAVITSV